jgi:hypothetical protein
VVRGDGALPPPGQFFGASVRSHTSFYAVAA